MTVPGFTAGSVRALRRGRFPRTGARTAWLLALLCLGVTAVVGWWLMDVDSLLQPPLPWWVLAVAFYAAEWLVVNLRFGRDVQSLSMTAAPLVIGLYTVAPLELIAAAGVAAVALAGSHRRQPISMLIFLVAQRMMLAAAALAVFAAAAPASDPLGPAGWLIAIAATQAALILRYATDYLVTRSTGVKPPPRELFEAFGFGSIVTALNAALGMLVARALFDAPRTAVFAIIPGVVLFGVYRAYAASRQERSRLKALYEATRDIHAAPQIETSLTVAASHAREMFEAEFCEIVLLLGPDADAYRTIVGPGDYQSAMDRVDLTRWRVVWDRVNSGQQPFVVDRLGSLASFAGERRLPIDAAMVAPISLGEKRSGMLVVANHVGDGGEFGPADIELLSTLADQVGVAVENGRLEDSLAELTALKEELRHQALHDGLTGLANRTLFSERVSHAMQLTRRNRSQLAVLFLDLDDFKNVNDSLGHAAGDEMLCEVSERLRRQCRPEDTIARLGGDEFGVLIEGVEDVQDATRVARRILDGLAAPILLSGREITAKVSIGIALGRHGDSADKVLHDADSAMYAVKRNGKGTFRLFEQSMHAEVIAQIQLQADLEGAVAKQELRLLYQPLVDLDTGAVRGFEALVRWEHTRKGWLGPDAFIPFAEETGIIHEIGKWVLWEALGRLRIWQDMLGPNTDDFEVTVNLSAKQLEDPEIIAEVARALEASQTDPALLVLEITETAMMRTAPERLDELRSLGVRLAIDDFGTGYSSLASLHRLPVDVLKIDRLFVEGLEDEDSASPFVSTIVGLGNALGLETIVEGIETKEQLERVRALGCTLGQGFYFARPLRPKQASALLQRQIDNQTVFDFVKLADGYRDHRLRVVR